MVVVYRDRKKRLMERGIEIRKPETSADLV